MTSVTAVSLTPNDSAVLGALFDPEATLSGRPNIQSSISSGYDRETTDFLQQQEVQLLSTINDGDSSKVGLAEVISRLDDIVEKYPEYASAYNNRAQVRRMNMLWEDLLSSPDEWQLILSDLDRAISLASPPDMMQAISPLQARVLASAYTHRGYLLYKASREEFPSSTIESVPSMQGLERSVLEEMSSRDFGLGGKYGNKIAQRMAVETNPYAKLCGSIVKEALQREMDNYRQST